MAYMSQLPSPITANNFLSKLSKRNLIFIIVGLIVLAGIVAGFWYWNEMSTPLPPTEADQNIADISLGSQILQRTQNLIKDRFPETNPLKQISKNPF